MAGSNAKPEGGDAPFSDMVSQLEAPRLSEAELDRELKALKDLMSPSGDGSPMDPSYQPDWATEWSVSGFLPSSEVVKLSLIHI